MIYFSFSLSNPFVQHDHNIVKNTYGKITKNKSWEFCVYKQKGLLISFGISWTTKQSHAGGGIDFGIFGYSVSLDISDDRHWDYKNSRWETYDDNEPKTN